MAAGHSLSHLPGPLFLQLIPLSPTSAAILLSTGPFLSETHIVLSFLPLKKGNFILTPCLPQATLTTPLPFIAKPFDFLNAPPRPLWLLSCLLGACPSTPRERSCTPTLLNPTSNVSLPLTLPSAVFDTMSFLEGGGSVRGSPAAAGLL